jgi:hypothetical protein
MIRTIRILVSSALLAGCASGPPPLPVEVRVPVATPCIAAPVARPELLTDGALAALDDYRLVLELARDRRLRQGYIAELEAVLAGCR